MIDENFKRVMESKTGCAVVMAGSGSDRDHIIKITNSLEKYGVPYQVRICSAHKQPKTLLDIIEEYNDIKGSATYIAVAGGTDALSGTLAYHALNPVISCPPDAPNQSCTTNPPGSSNAYIPNPKNVGRFIAQMYANVNPRFKGAIEKEKAEKIQSLEESDEYFHKEEGKI